MTPLTVSCKVNIKFGDRCSQCGTFFETACLQWIGASRFCTRCAGKLSGNLTVIRWRASEIGQLASSAIGSSELIGVEAIETVLQAITELSNEIANLLPKTA